MIRIEVKGMAGAASAFGWLTYEQREWWNQKGKRLYPNITILNSDENFWPEFFLVWNWSSDEVYVGVKDYRQPGEEHTVLLHVEYSDVQPDVKAFQKAIDFIHRWITGQAAKKELSFIPLEWAGAGNESQTKN